MSLIKRGRFWHIKITVNGETIRRSTKTGNRRAAEQIEAALKVDLAKGNVGLRKKIPAPTLREFLTKEFQPFMDANCTAKLKTYRYYQHGLKQLLAFDRLANAQLDEITGDHIAAYVSKRFGEGLQIHKRTPSARRSSGDMHRQDTKSSQWRRHSKRRIAQKWR